MGSLKNPCTTSYRSSLDTIALDCLVFEKIAYFCILATVADRLKVNGTHYIIADAWCLFSVLIATKLRLVQHNNIVPWPPAEIMANLPPKMQ